MKKLYFCCAFFVSQVCFAAPPPAPPAPANLVTTTTGSLTSAELTGALTDENGTGEFVCDTNPNLTQIMGIGATTLRAWPASWDIIQMGDGDDLAFFQNGNGYIGYVAGMYTTDGVNWQYSMTDVATVLVDANLAGGGYWVVHTGLGGAEDAVVNQANWHSLYFDPYGRFGVDIVPDTTANTIFTPIALGGNSYIFGNRTTAASGSLGIAANAFYNASNQYEAVSTDEASMGLFYNGNFLVRVSDVVTAGNTITWTNALEVKKNGATYAYKGLVVGDATAGVDFQLIFDGETTDGYCTWMEDEDFFLFGDDVSLTGGENVVLDTTTGSQVGTAAAQKLGFWGATPVVQPASTGETVGFTAGVGTGVNDDSTFTGNVGSTAYRISDVVKALKQAGILAQ